MICWDTGLGIERTDDIVFVQVFQQGRTREKKQAMFAELAKQLKEQCGVQGNDLLITLAANEKEDWSFGFGRAQFLTGEL